MRRLRQVLVPALVPALGLALAAVAPVGAHAAGGTTGTSFTLQSGTSLAGYDVATTKNGTTYVGWIGDKVSTPGLRDLHLCVLKPTSRSCVGGVQTASALGTTSAQNLKVVVRDDGQVELVWIAQIAPNTGEFTGVFGTNVVSNGTLGTSVAIPGAPTFGTLTSAIPHKAGTVSVAVVGNSSHDAYYYPTLTTAPKTLTRPYVVGNAQLADNGKQTVLTASQAGSISGKVSVASKSSTGTKWSAFKNVAGSWTVGGSERVQVAGGHIRMVGVSGKAIYFPYSWTWNGKSFGKPRSTGDHNDISSIDTATDGSGRLVTVDSEVNGLMVSNFGGGSHTSRFLMRVTATYAGGPAQISTSASGRGFLIWGIEKNGVPAQILKAQAIRLSALTKTVHQHGRAGKLSLTGPASCLPMTSVHVKVTGKAAHGWNVVSKKLRLGSKKVGSSINGAKLKPHRRYTLKGSVTFRNGGQHSTLSKKLSFTTCGRP